MSEKSDLKEKTYNLGISRIQKKNIRRNFLDFFREHYVVTMDVSGLPANQERVNEMTKEAMTFLQRMKRRRNKNNV